MALTKKHTPGPWDVTTVDHSSGGNGATPSTLFRVGFRSYENFTGRVADSCHGDSYANAHLIAAAPEMLEALKGALAAIEGSEARLGFDLPEGNAVRAAIAKAEGR